MNTMRLTGRAVSLNLASSKTNLPKNGTRRQIYTRYNSSDIVPQKPKTLLTIFPSLETRRSRMSRSFATRSERLTDMRTLGMKSFPSGRMNSNLRKTYT